MAEFEVTWHMTTSRQCSYSPPLYNGGGPGLSYYCFPDLTHCWPAFSRVFLYLLKYSLVYSLCPQMPNLWKLNIRFKTNLTELLITTTIQIVEHIFISNILHMPPMSAIWLFWDCAIYFFCARWFLAEYEEKWRLFVETGNTSLTIDGWSINTGRPFLHNKVCVCIP